MSLPLPTFKFPTFNVPAIATLDPDFYSRNWINYNGDKVDLQRSIDNFEIEADALRASPESCLIYVNRRQSVVQHSFRVQLNFLPWKEVVFGINKEVDEYTRAHTRIGFVVEQAGQRFFTKPYAWPPHQASLSNTSPKLSVICDSCRTTSSWRSRPVLSFQSNESSSSLFVFEPGTPFHFGCYICYWPNTNTNSGAAVPAETSSSSPQLLKFQFQFSIDELQIDGWDVIKEDRFDDRSRWLNWKGERLDRNNTLRSDSPQQFEISAHCLASIEGAALIYINQDNQISLEELPSRLQMIFRGSYYSPSYSLMRIGFVMQQGSSSKGPSLRRFFSKETFPWPSGKNYRIQLLVNQHTIWLSALDSKKGIGLNPKGKELGTSVVLDGSKESLFFGFYIQLHADTYATCQDVLPEDYDIKFEVELFKVVAEYVDHGLEQSITHSGTYLRSRLVPGLTRFIRKSGGGTDDEEERVFQGLSLDGEILTSHDDGNGLMMTLPAAAGGGSGDEEWKVEQSTYPPCAFYDAEAFEDKPELLRKIFGKRKPIHVSKTFANSVRQQWKGTPRREYHRRLCRSSHDKLIQSRLAGLIDKLKSITIRGIKLYDLLRLLAFRNGIAYPLAITGGSIRDAMQGKDCADIEIVVGGTYDEVCHYLCDLFVSHGESVTENTLFTKKSAKQFGQLKIMNMKGKPEPLDIALFKVPCNLLTTKLSSSKTSPSPSPSSPTSSASSSSSALKYVFGWRYVEDAKTRGYSMNALYLQLFPTPVLIDPLGYGYDDAYWKKPILRLAYPEAFASDLGGQFRFWKLFDGSKYQIPKLLYEIPTNVRTIGGQSGPLDKHVDKLICDHISMLESKEEELVEWYAEKKQSCLDQLKQKQLQLNKDEKKKKKLKKELCKMAKRSLKKEEIKQQKKKKDGNKDEDEEALEEEKGREQKEYEHKQHQLEELKTKKRTIAKEKKEIKELEEQLKETLEEKLNVYFSTLRSKLFKEVRHMPEKVKKMHVDMKGRDWWKRTIQLARCKAAQQLFDSLRSQKLSKVRPSLETVLLVNLIAVPTGEEKAEAKAKAREEEKEDSRRGESKEDKEKECSVNLTEAELKKAKEENSTQQQE